MTQERQKQILPFFPYVKRFFLPPRNDMTAAAVHNSVKRNATILTETQEQEVPYEKDF